MPLAQVSSHARVAYLLKEGAEIGQVMNYRPLTIASPLYRCWGACRLEDMHMWVQMWSLEEMFAGVPGRGAVDAWHEVLTTLEECKLEDNSYCGGVADIAKFFDQIKRAMLYQVAAAAGMPTGVLTAYKAYLENLLLYNVHAGGLGDPIEYVASLKAAPYQWQWSR